MIIGSYSIVILINDELYALDINKIEKDISNLKENEINNFL